MPDSRKCMARSRKACVCCSCRCSQTDDLALRESCRCWCEGSGLCLVASYEEFKELLEKQSKGGVDNA